MRKSMRLIDMGEVTPLHSQTMPHAVGHAVSTGMPDTLVLARSAGECVSIGKYQELARDVNLGWCESHNVPVFRRQTGGGAHYISTGHLLFHTVFSRTRFAKSITKLNQDVLRAVVKTYVSLGVDAHYRPVSNVFVREAPISRANVGTIRGAVVLGSYLAVSGDPHSIAQALRLDEDDTPTTMAAEVGRALDPNEVREVFLDALASQLRVNFEPADPTDAELSALEDLDKSFMADDWVHSVDRRVAEVKKLRDSDDTAVAEGRHRKRDEGVIRATVAIKDGRIRDIAFAGDIFLNLDHVQGLERSFRGCEVEWDDLMTVAENYYLGLQVDSPGTDPTDWVSAITIAGDRASA